MKRCCTYRLWSEPEEGDQANCLTCGRRWVALTKLHVGVPTWWTDKRERYE